VPTPLGDFLRSRREKVHPDVVGSAVGSTVRRVAGLRREEVALRAGMSVDYYVRLEQGRALNPSEAVLDAIARVLALDETERTHLHRLGRAGPPRARSSPPEVLRPGIARLLANLDGIPAYVLGRQLDLIAWTRSGSALLGGFAGRPSEQRNLARLVFLDPQMEQLLPDWRSVACETVGLLQLAAGRKPGDAGIAAVVEELSLKRQSFRELWAVHDVAEVTAGPRRFRHPVVGDVTLSFETLIVPDDCSQTLVTYTADPGTAPDTALKLLASWAASEEPGVGAPQRGR
jgi:transcriptional regulator with XRE-family HTH domain